MATTQERIRIAFMGTPQFAAVILERLVNWPGCELCGVWCQPDRPAGRGQKLQAPVVRILAEHHQLAVYQPENFKAPEDRKLLADCRPDVLAVAAYGLVLPQIILDIPRLAPLNVHASILPAYRGAAPIQRAIMDGCATTGVSIMHMEAGLDSGPVYAARSVDIGEHSAASLHDVLADMGAQLLVEVLEDLVAGRAQAQAQDTSKLSFAPKLSKNDGHIRWHAPVATVHAQVRAVTPWPGARLLLSLPSRQPGAAAREITVTLMPGQICVRRPDAPSGSLWLDADGGLGMVCQDGLYLLSSLRPADRAFMSAGDFVRGFLVPGVRGFCGKAC